MYLIMCIICNSLSLCIYIVLWFHVVEYYNILFVYGGCEKPNKGHELEINNSYNLFVQITSVTLCTP